MKKMPSHHSRKKTASLQVRIISGKWRGRKLRIHGDSTLRPTPGRSRETLFNWLRAELPGSQCLDLFAGSGVLGLESLSLAAQHVTLVESHPATCRALAGIIHELDTTAQCTLVRMDAIRYLQQLIRSGADQPPGWDIIYLDPPFQQPRLLDEAMQLITTHQLASRFIYMETATADRLEGLAQQYDMDIYRRQRSGDSHGALLIPGIH